ncbi:MAG: phosphoadenosine phosphosulfate reductase family protein [Desulfurococcales archaeon]|nr:phosphoadenosine phosphosulfate reductase family protein [Desulfurococcales archaeon]
MKKAGPKQWPVVARIYWCPELNVPLLGRECPDGGRARLLRLTEPGDARPAFPHDLKVMEYGYKYETGGVRGISGLLGEGVILFNKVPFMDLMYEVVSQGVIIARVYWDPYLSHWRLRFSQPGLKRVWHLEPLPRYIVRGGMRVLRRKRVFQNDAGLPPGSQVALVNDEGEPIGIAYVTRDGSKISTHTVFWRDQPAWAGRGNRGWDNVVKANDYYLYYYTSRAVKFIHVMNEKVKKPVIVSFSGGKDSLVSLHLTLRTGLKPYLLFNNTGIEMPETVETVKKTAEKYGLELLVADAGDSFWRAVERVGPPGKDYRWCCKVTKLAPLSRLLEAKFPDGALNIVGQRAFESLDRARSPRVWRNKWLPKILNISPIQEWPQLLIWLYIWREGLEYNPLYERGFDRIGCFMCPAAFSAEYEFVKETRPELWARWEKILYKWADRLGLKGPLKEAWVKKGLWRWLTPAVQKQRLAYRLGVELPDWRELYRKWLTPSISEGKLEGKRWEVKLTASFDPESLKDQYTVLGAFEVEEYNENEIVLRGPRGVRVTSRGQTVRVEGAKGILARELLLDTLKLQFRWTHCAGCKACETSCPTGAIKVKREGDGFRPVVDPGLCIHCKLCLDNCPLADVTVERIYPALLLGEVTAWRRNGKRTRESVVQRYMRLKGVKIDVEGARLLDEDALSATSTFYEGLENG